MVTTTPIGGHTRRRDEVQRQQEAAIIEAAAAEFRRVGARQANIDRIAEEAGVSRSTLYRRFPSKEDLAAEVVNRSRRRFVREVAERVAGLDPRATVVEAFCLSLTQFRHNVLVTQVFGSDPEGNPLVGFETPHLKAMVTEFGEGIAATLRAAGASMPDKDLRLASEVMVRMVISLTTAPTEVLDVDDDDALRHFATTFLAPMIW